MFLGTEASSNKPAVVLICIQNILCNEISNEILFTLESIGFLLPDKMNLHNVSK